MGFTTTVAFAIIILNRDSSYSQEMDSAFQTGGFGRLSNNRPGNGLVIMTRELEAEIDEAIQRAAEIASTPSSETHVIDAFPPKSSPTSLPQTILLRIPLLGRFDPPERVTERYQQMSSVSPLTSEVSSVPPAIAATSLADSLARPALNTATNTAVNPPLLIIHHDAASNQPINGASSPPEATSQYLGSNMGLNGNMSHSIPTPRPDEPATPTHAPNQQASSQVELGVGPPLLQDNRRPITSSPETETLPIPLHYPPPKPQGPRPSPSQSNSPAPELPSQTQSSASHTTLATPPQAQSTGDNVHLSPLTNAFQSRQSSISEEGSSIYSGNFVSREGPNGIQSARGLIHSMIPLLLNQTSTVSEAPLHPSQSLLLINPPPNPQSAPVTISRGIGDGDPSAPQQTPASPNSNGSQPFSATDARHPDPLRNPVLLNNPPTQTTQADNTPRAQNNASPGSSTLVNTDASRTPPGSPPPAYTSLDPEGQTESPPDPLAIPPAPSSGGQGSAEPQPPPPEDPTPDRPPTDTTQPDQGNGEGNAVNGSGQQNNQPPQIPQPSQREQSDRVGESTATVGSGRQNNQPTQRTQPHQPRQHNQSNGVGGTQGSSPTNGQSSTHQANTGGNRGSANNNGQSSTLQEKSRNGFVECLASCWEGFTAGLSYIFC
ncbi:hypothetical protein SISSUDRAFT_128297 [Sistotremastrum suecicum HHB10207 ss-3]|uniref:Uncharacterized protein n=1 Tax=Sistotremastrum suecicum HHB10207 ss-3 TaxID=1314776 RepID=A0A166AYL1_9AGAM|nr:hypothetical protein SISSUDRAFT_128297 [Sistotremastrum suecicum HHB10207 ss-3]